MSVIFFAKINALQNIWICIVAFNDIGTPDWMWSSLNKCFKSRDTVSYPKTLVYKNYRQTQIRGVDYTYWYIKRFASVIWLSTFLTRNEWLTVNFTYTITKWLFFKMFFTLPRKCKILKQLSLTFFTFFYLFTTP